MTHIAQYIVPTIILLIIFLGVSKDLKVFDIFVEGAVEGLKIVVRILPVLMGLILAVSALKSSGAIDLLLLPIMPLAIKLGVPADIMPLALLRPVSGSASLALLSEIIVKTGADSHTTKIGATLLASTETSLYTVALYFGTTKIKNYRYTLPAALLCDFAAVALSVVFVNLLKI